MRQGPAGGRGLATMKMIPAPAAGLWRCLLAGGGGLRNVPPRLRLSHACSPVSRAIAGD